MSDLNKQFPLKTLKQVWGLTKSPKHSKFKKQFPKVSKQKDHKILNLFETRVPISKTVPVSCQNFKLPHLNSTTQSLHEMLNSQQLHSSKYLPTVVESEARIDSLLKHKLKLLVLINKRRLFNRYQGRTQNDQLIQEIDTINRQITIFIKAIRDISRQTQNPKQLHQSSSKSLLYCNKKPLKSPNKTNSQFSIKFQKQKSTVPILGLPSHFRQQMVKLSVSPDNKSLQKFSSYKSQFPRLNHYRSPIQKLSKQYQSLAINSLSQLQQHEWQQKVDFQKLYIYQKKFRNLKSDQDSVTNVFSNKLIKNKMKMKKTKRYTDDISEDQYFRLQIKSRKIREMQTKSFELDNLQRKALIIKPKNKNLNLFNSSSQQQTLKS